MGRRKKMWTYLIILGLIFFPIYRYNHKLQKLGKQLLTNWLAHRLVELHHDYYIVNYPYGSNWYKIKIPRDRTPRIILEITENEKEVTEEIVQFIGPCYNFHGICTTPKFLGFEELKIDTLEHSFIFRENDRISISI